MWEHGSSQSMREITTCVVATCYSISDVSSQMGRGDFLPPQLRNLGSECDRADTQILQTRPGPPHVPNMVKIGLGVWAGPIPSLSRHWFSL